MTSKKRREAPEKALSRTEWEMMNLCWRLGRATARQVLEASSGKRRRDYQTVKTLLDRITAKGYLEMSKLGPLCLYTPVVERRQAVTRAVREFVDTVLERRPAPLMLQMVEDEQLSEEELEELRALLARKERGG